SRRARADHRHRLWQFVERPGLLGADHTTTELGARDRPLHRTGRDHDELRLIRVLSDLDLALTGKRPRAVDHVDLVLLEQPRHPTSERCDNLVAPIHHGTKINGRFAYADTE